jgi:hypothetical protein
MIRWAGRAIAAWAKPRADLIAENLCLRQQLIVLRRRTPRPRLRDGDRRFWILACRWIPPMAPVSPRRSARDRARLASQGMEGLLAMAVAARNARRAASYRGGTVCPHPEDGCGESPLGATPRPGRARTVRVPGVGADCRHVYAQALPRCPFTQLARVLEAPCPGHLGVRLLLCSHDLLPDAAHLLRDAPRDSRDPASSGDPTSHRRMGGPADRGRVWLGAGPTAVSDPFGIEFDRRVQRLGITQIRTPVRAPRANALAERWIRSARRECLDQVVIINERHLQQVLDLTLEMRLARDLSQRSLPSILRPG